jgi:flagellin
MPITINTNSSATEATFNLSRANDSLRRTIARLSSGNRITKPIDDAGGLAVAYKLQSTVKRTEAALNNHQNALSYLQVQDGVLEAIGEIVDRMSELRTMAADVSKNAADVENYSKEFLELQDQLHQMKREKFNGVELFAVEDEWDTIKGLNKAHMYVNGLNFEDTADTDLTNDEFAANMETYEYFDNTDPNKRTLTAYDKYEFQLYTHPSGDADDGSLKLNIINLQFLLGIKDPKQIDDDFSTIDPDDGNGRDTVQTNETINLGGLQQRGSAIYGQSNALTNDTDNTDNKFTDSDTTTDGVQEGYIKDITEISIEEFTNVIEKIADARAENGAEQQRINQSMRLQQNNLVNLEAAHGRIMDVDVALESSRLARNSVKVQASAAMVAQANQMTGVALTLLQ